MNPLLHFTPDDISSRSHFLTQQAYSIMSEIRKNKFKGYAQVGDDVANENVEILKSNGFRLYQVIYPKGTYYMSQEKKLIYIIWKSDIDFDTHIFKPYITRFGFEDVSYYTL